MPTATARVRTDNPQRYAKQLCEHLGRRSTAEYADGKGLITLTSGTVRLDSEPGELVMVAEAPNDEDLAVACDVAGRHLERFGQRHELTVEWFTEDADPALG